MWKARAFVIAHFVFYAMPIALISAGLFLDGSRREVAILAVMLPSMAIALLAQMFRCPNCGALVYSLKRAHDEGFFKRRKLLAFMKCQDCGHPFWPRGPHG